MRQVIKLSSSGVIVETYNSVMQAAQENYIAKSSMHRYCQSNKEAPDGWIYRFKEVTT